MSLTPSLTRPIPTEPMACVVKEVNGSRILGPVLKLLGTGKNLLSVVLCYSLERSAFSNESKGK